MFILSLEEMVIFCFYFLKGFIFLSNLYPRTWGLNARPQDQESHAVPTEPDGSPRAAHSVEFVLPGWTGQL